MWQSQNYFGYLLLCKLVISVFNFFVLYLLYTWRGGSLDRIRDCEVAGSSLIRVPLRSNIGQVISTCVPLSTNSRVWH